MLASSVAVSAGMIAAGAAGAAVAADANISGAKAVLVDGPLKHGQFIDVATTRGGKRSTERAQGGIIQLKTGDQTLDTYCIDLHNPTQRGAKYQETGWESSSLAGNEDAGRILWILQHSYPQVSAGQLAKDTQIGGLSEDEAAAGTQAAIWHFSDGADAVPEDGKANELTKYLIKNAQQLEEPKPTLSLAPTSVSGKSGALLGPITVTTNGSSVDLAVDADGAKAGLTITDKAGKAITSAKPGEEIYAKAPVGGTHGTATIKATTAAQVSVGRAFTGVNADNVHSQTLILAGSEAVPATAGVTVNWAPAGPIPAVTSKVDCVQGAVVVTATNNGDQDYTFTLNGKTYTVKPGGTTSVPIKVEEDKPYHFTVTGPNGFKQDIQGVLNCKTDTAITTPGSSESPKPSPSPSSSTGGGTGGSTGGSTGGGLAFTGGGSETPWLAGTAGALLIAGGGAVFALRRRGRHSRTSA
ncbi:Cys-Gln thioester bond-forming surface protein [Kitasatospora sp. HPMI-4]|uniref:Cys-Gln thioester bond-forming surface protein n=1 Tax=Kitasatospora sp. HPMI-4 TaxID=3448443 RepID=UPI003F1B3039